MTEGEKTIFRFVIFGSLITAIPLLAVGAILPSDVCSVCGAFLVLFAVLFSMFWFFQACMDSLKDYGLGEGMANLYGEERAKMMFGEDYKRSGTPDD